MLIYSNPSSIPNLLKYIKNNTNIVINPQEKRGKIGEDIFNSNNYFYITGHGNINFSDKFNENSFQYAQSPYAATKISSDQLSNSYLYFFLN